MKTVKVRFSADASVGANRTYDYLTDIDGVAVDDFVVVDSPNSGYTVVRVIEVVTSETVKATKWVVDKVDVAKHKQRLAADAERKEILALLEKKSRKIEEVQKYQYLAGVDPDAAGLLARLKELGNV